MTKAVNFKVGMTCSGCQRAISRILNKIDGVNEVKTNLDTKLVEVVCEDAVDASTLHSALLKWASSSGKSVEILSS